MSLPAFIVASGLLGVFLWAVFNPAVERLADDISKFINKLDTYREAPRMSETTEQTAPERRTIHTSEEAEA